MKQQKSLIITISILVLAIIAVFVISFNNPVAKPNQYEYNGFVFNQFRLPSAPGMVFHGVDLTVGNKKYEIPFRNDPNDLESISVNGLEEISWIRLPQGEIGNYNLIPNNLYLTFNPVELSGGDIIIAGGNLARVFGQTDSGIYKLPITGAFTYPINNSATPIIDCNDASNEVGVIKFELGEENRIITDGDCVILEGRDYNGIIRTSDRFLMEILGITKDE